jgi:hypothetical protein
MRIVKTIITATDIECSYLKSISTRMEGEMYITELYRRASDKYHLNVIKRSPLTLSYCTASGKIVMFHYDNRRRITPHKKAYKYQELLKSKCV